jgi:hypothetical protein
VTPAEFSHPALFAMKPKLDLPPVAEAPVGEPPLARIRLATTATALDTSPASPTAAPAVEFVKPVAPAAEPAPAAQPEPAPAAGSAATPSLVPKTNPDDDGVRITNEILKAVTPAPETAPATVATPAPAETPAAPAPVAEPAAPAPEAAPVTTATVPAPPPAPEPILGLKPQNAVKLSILTFDKDLALRPGPLSVFISRKEGKLFVRKQFSPLFTASVTIADPDKPIGTHIFTAMDVKDKGPTMRWTVVSLPDERSRKADLRLASTKKGAPVLTEPVHALDPAQALSRITIDPDTIKRITELMGPGASLTISDQGLGPETGRETDFIVVTR